jgi:CheY-like chemotaxis protein
MKAATHSLCVLVVDDHDATAEILAEYLNGIGFDAYGASSGQEALQIAETRQPACVLLDLHMPRMNGVELGQRLRQRFQGDITLISMTGEDSQAYDYKLMLSICDYMLAKPVDLDRLKKILLVAEEG